MRAARVQAQLPHGTLPWSGHIQPIQNTTSQLPRINVQGVTEQLECVIERHVLFPKLPNLQLQFEVSPKTDKFLKQD
jgi:hypothetical protein